jgi:hypothetical protein
MNVKEGTATGPVVIVPSGGGIDLEATVTALWSDTDGVCVTLELLGDGIITVDSLPAWKESAARVIAAVEQLLGLEQPHPATAHHGG